MIEAVTSVLLTMREVLSEASRAEMATRRLLDYARAGGFAIKTEIFIDEYVHDADRDELATRATCLAYKAHTPKGGHGADARKMRGRVG